MSVIKYIGRKTDFCGKTLWEIVGNLKNYGVGRIVVRNMFERYPEPCYMEILKVEALPSEDTRKVKVTVKNTFRGNTLYRPTEICSTSYKADYRLIPKDEEYKYTQRNEKAEIKLLPKEIEFPPLLKEYIEDETGTKNPTMKLNFRKTRNKLCRYAKKNEVPNVEVGMGLGKPISPKLYENINC